MTQHITVRKNIRRLKTVKTWQLVLLLILVGFIAATFLRLNNVGMVERRSAVLGADKAGNIDDIQRRLYDLQRYSAAHMNAATGPFFLTHQYERDSQKILAAAADDSNPNGNIYAKADQVCKPQFGNTYSPAYQQCFLDELNKYPAASGIDNKPDLPNQSLYRHDFASPLWSPDFAGWTIVVGIVIILLIVIRFITLAILLMILKRRYRDV